MFSFLKSVRPPGRPNKRKKGLTWESLEGKAVNVYGGPLYEVSIPKAHLLRKLDYKECGAVCRAARAAAQAWAKALMRDQGLTAPQAEQLGYTLMGNALPSFNPFMLAENWGEPSMILNFHGTVIVLGCDIKYTKLAISLGFPAEIRRIRDRVGVPLRTEAEQKRGVHEPAK